MNTIIDKEGRELKTHGTPGFPCAVYGEAACGFPWHWHDELEMVYVEKGRFTMAIAERRYEMSAGDGVFINAGAPHALFSIDGGIYYESDVVFHPRILYGDTDSVLWENYFSHFLRDEALAGLPLYHQEPWQKQAAERIAQACALCRDRPPAYEFLVREALTRVCVDIWAHSRRQAAMPKAVYGTIDKAKRIMRFLSERYQENVTLDDLSAHMYLSKRECQRVLGAHIGLTPVQYLIQLRLSKAADLLRTKDMAITDICYQCGFQNSSYFAKQFRQRYDRTPREYRAFRAQPDGGQ